MPDENSQRESWNRIIVHADMDAFYASVEQLDHPEYRGKPLIVGGTEGRGVVTTASYEARPFGVGSAMSMVRALRLCPHAIVVSPRFERYQEASSQVMKAFRDFAGHVEPISMDEAFLDMTGTEQMFQSPRIMAKRIQAAVFDGTAGLTVSVGVANTKFVAKVASDYNKPNGITVVRPSRVREFLDPLSVSRLWGVGPKNRERLEKLGLYKIRDVARADAYWLSRELGSLGTHVYRLSNNDDPRQVRGGRSAKSVGAECTLREDVTGARAIRPHLLAAADRVAARLRKKNLRACGLRVKLKTAGFQLHSRQMGLKRPCDDGSDFFMAASELLARFDLAEPMRLVGVAAFDLVDGGIPIQQDLFEDDPIVRRQLNQAIDQLRERFGKGTVRRASTEIEWHDQEVPL